MALIHHARQMEAALAHIPSNLHLEAGSQPTWLLSDYSSHEWKVANTGSKPPKIIVFNVTMPGGATLSDFPNLYDTIKKVAYGVRTGPLADVASADVQVSVVNNLTTLACWMIANDIVRFDQLVQADVDEYAKVAVYGVHSILNTESLLERYLEQLISKAEFSATDKESARRAKAVTVFPCLYKADRKGSRIIRPIALNRTQILNDAGLDHIGTGGHGSVLTTLLDETEALCAFSQKAMIKNRTASPECDQEDETVSEEHLRRFLMSFQYVWRHRRYLNDAPTADPFFSTSPRVQARKLGSIVGRTGTVPVKQATHFIERSVRWVLDYSPLLLELKQWRDLNDGDDRDVAVHNFATKLALIQEWPVGPASPFPILAANPVNSRAWNDEVYGQALQGGMSLESAMIYLMTACAVVIAAFSARRAAEIGGLKAGCIHLDDSGQPWMKCFIHKTLQADSQIPVPAVVVAAVTILERISEQSRLRNGTPYLFQYTKIGSTKTYGLTIDGLPSFNLRANIRRFGYFVDVPLLPDQTRWTFKPHQFRRFFAIVYIWVYDRGDWGALQWHLRHFTSETTRRYVTENEIGQIIAVANKEHTAEILVNASMGLTQIGGLEGARLKAVAQRIHNRLAQRVEVVSERKFRQKIEKFVQRTGLELVAFPWGYCGVKQTNVNGQCNCTNINKPDYDQASEVTCTGCMFNVLTPGASPFLSTALQFHKEIAESAESPVILRRASAVIQIRLETALSQITHTGA